MSVIMPRLTAEEAKRIRKDVLRLTQHQMARALGIENPDQYRNWEYRNGPPEDVSNAMLRLAKAQGYVTESDDLRPVSLLFGPMARIPVVGNVAAGPGAHNVDVDQHGIYVPASLGQLGGTAFVVDGESMMPALEPGDVAVFKEQRQPRRGFTYLIKHPDHSYAVKNLDWSSRDGQWVLVSLNPSHPTSPLHDSELVGLLVGWYRSIGSYEKLEADPNGLRLQAPQ